MTDDEMFNRLPKKKIKRARTKTKLDPNLNLDNVSSIESALTGSKQSFERESSKRLTPYRQERIASQRLSHSERVEILVSLGISMQWIASEVFGMELNAFVNKFRDEIKQGRIRRVERVATIVWNNAMLGNNTQIDLLIKQFMKDKFDGDEKIRPQLTKAEITEKLKQINEEKMGPL